MSLFLVNMLRKSVTPPIQVFSSILSYCSRLSVDLLSYNSRSTLNMTRSQKKSGRIFLFCVSFRFSLFRTCVRDVCLDDREIKKSLTADSRNTISQRAHSSFLCLHFPHFCLFHAKESSWICSVSS